MSVVGTFEFPQVIQCKTGPTSAALVWTRRSLACDTFKALEALTGTPVAITMPRIGAFDIGVRLINSVSFVSPRWSRGACALRAIRGVAISFKAGALALSAVAVAIARVRTTRIDHGLQEYHIRPERFELFRADGASL
jgi:hypothetical protein